MKTCVPKKNNAVLKNRKINFFTAAICIAGMLISPCGCNEKRTLPSEKKISGQSLLDYTTGAETSAHTRRLNRR